MYVLLIPVIGSISGIDAAERVEPVRARRVRLDSSITSEEWSVAREKEAGTYYHGDIFLDESMVYIPSREITNSHTAFVPSPRY